MNPFRLMMFTAGLYFLLLQACYDVREAVALWQVTQAKVKYSDGGEIPEFLSPHPANESRVQKLREYLPQVSVGLLIAFFNTLF